jgi:two-component system, NtrC family, response regulator HydG
MNARVLIVDDDPEMREALGTVFSGDGETCEVAANAAVALDLIEQRTFDVVVSDVRMDGMSGLELLDRVKRVRPSLPFILITGAAAVRDAVDAIKRGAFQYITKPCDAVELRAMVLAALGRSRGEMGRGARRTQPPSAPPAAPPREEFVGDGPAMRALQSSIDRVATSTAPVLVTGETGVGKEVVARAIHARSERRSRPFVAVNMSAVQDSLFESELFGHVRGAFTGAMQSRSGLLTEADGGTLFLDEIGDMPMGMQAKLLRVLQFGEVRPVGSDRPHGVDVRVIAATHRDLPVLIREGRFREDLYFRLNVLPIFVPPLRARRDDIPALARHFLSEARQRASTPVQSIGEGALRVLMDGAWPGNVRELASAIERAVVFSSDEVLTAEHLSHIVPEPAPTLSWPALDRAPWTLDRLNRAYTEWVIEQTGGDKPRAAEILGVNLSTLYRWRRAQHD